MFIKFKVQGYGDNVSRFVTHASGEMEIEHHTGCMNAVTLKTKDFELYLDTQSFTLVLVNHEEFRLQSESTVYEIRASRNTYKLLVEGLSPYLKLKLEN